MLYSKRRMKGYDLASIWIHEDGSITAGREDFDSLDEFKDALQAYYKPRYSRNYYDEDEYTGYGLDDPYKTTASTGGVKRYNSFDDSSNTKNDSDSDNLFKHNQDLYDFLLEVFNFLSEEGPDEQYLSPKEMQKLLDKYNKKVEDLVIWLHNNREDYTKTYGLIWNDEENIFEVEQPT